MKWGNSGADYIQTTTLGTGKLGAGSSSTDRESILGS